MRLKLFRAASMADAMSQVRRDLGIDALILTSRMLADGVEVTAALDGEMAAAAEPPLPEPGLLEVLEYHGVRGALAGALEKGRDLRSGLAQALRFGALPLAVDAAPLLLAGPPGAGKTLTAARLATRLVLGGVNPVVITADGRRAGATEQLAAYTRLLNINLLVASHPGSLAKALTRRQEGAPVIIDAPGSDPFDPSQRDELTALAGAAEARIVLVLPAGLDPAEACDLAEGFAEAGARLLIATRLDLARRIGGILAAAAAAPLTLAEAGIGPGAADGLVAMTPQLLADRLLNGSGGLAAFAQPARTPQEALT